MNKSRVYDLAKELDINSKELVTILQSMDIPVKNHMSALTEQQEKYFRNNFEIDGVKIAAKNVPKVEEQKPAPVEPPAKPATTQGSSPAPRQDTAQTSSQNARPSSGQTSNNTSRPSSGQAPRPSSSQAPRQNSGQSARPSSGQSPRPSSGQTSRPSSGQGPRPSSGQGPRQASGQSSSNAPRQATGQASTHTSRQATKPAAKPQYGKSSTGGGERKTGAANLPDRTRPDQSGIKTDNRKNKKKRVITPVAIDNSKKEKKSRGDYKKKRGEDGLETEIFLIPTTLTVGDLAAKINVPTNEIIKTLIGLGIMASINQIIDFETAEVVATELSIAVELEDVEEEVAEILSQVEEEADDEANMVHRAPVITVMGHVDHGKTSLLDAIRQTSVTEKEAGGITQHIGAYTVKARGENITFIDTPGHEAFTAMRHRGASITDIAVLVVAADDGVMPQTVEAINHAKAAKVPIIVAINKMDKPEANAERVKQELTEYNLVAEEWGGDTICVPVSAKTREGLDSLLEMILLVSEVLELKANPNRLAKATVLEAKLDKGRGPVSTVLVNAGTLHVGDAVVSGTAYGKIRAMINDKGKKVKTAGPATPVEVLGLNEVPEAGDEFYAVHDDRTARQIAEKRKSYIKDQRVKKSAPLSLDDLYSQIKQGEVQDINLIIKGDVQGSVEALKQSLEKLTNEEVRVNIIHAAAGAISESDVVFAAASNAIIIGFNVRPNLNVAAVAERESVDIRLYRVIYNAIEDIEKAMKGMLAPIFKEVVLGTAEVRQTFKLPTGGVIAGSYVTSGKIHRNNEVRVIRDGIVIHEGKLVSLKRFKDDAREVAQGYECGIGLDRFNDIKEGDIMEAYTMEEVART